MKEQKCKGPEADMRLKCLRNCKEARKIAGDEKMWDV